MTKAPIEGTDIYRLYEQLFDCYGPQGWWPLVEESKDDAGNTCWQNKYHEGEYDYPKNDAQRFQICLGAILTQNTAWDNAAKALVNLAKHGILECPDKILSTPDDELKQYTRPSGYYNIKARKLKAFCRFYRTLDDETPDRKQLLDTWGIGPETADSILLYAYNMPEMVVDAYTRRILHHCGLVSADIAYEQLKQLCRQSVPRDVSVYQEFHALIVAHGKRYKSTELTDA